MAGYNDSEGPYTTGAPGFKTHLSHVTDITNKFDKDATPNSGDVPTWNGTVYAPAAPALGGIVANGTDDAPQINAAITALGSNGGTIRLRGTGHKINSLVIFPNGVGLVGDGSNMDGASMPGTRILCTSAAAGLRFDGSGATSMGFTVDGNGVANTCIKQTLGAQRTFVGVEAENALFDNWVIEKAQNAGYYGCSVQGAGRDNLVLDLGCGGLGFFRFESNGAGRYCLRSIQSGSSPEVYAAPTHITFDTCVFERPTGNTLVASLEVGDYIKFDHTVFERSVASSAIPVIDQLLDGTVEYASCRFFNSGAGTTGAGISITDWSRVLMTGMNEFFGTPYAIHATVGDIFLLQYPLLNSGVALHSPTTDANARFVNSQAAPTKITRDATTDIALETKLEADAGRRLRLQADGFLTWGSGADFSFPLKLGRNSDGTALRVDGSTTQTTSPSAGGAGALPATPAGYIRLNIGGTNRLVPYY